MNRGWGHQTTKDIPESLLTYGRAPVTHIKIDQAYTLGKPGQKTQNPRPIMIKLTSGIDKETVIHKSREIPYNNRPRLTEDFPPELRDTRKKLIPFLIKAKNNGKKTSLTNRKQNVLSRRFGKRCS